MERGERAEEGEKINAARSASWREEDSSGAAESLPVLPPQPT